MPAQLMMTPGELIEFLAQRRDAHKSTPAWKRSSYTHVRCRQPKGWRVGTKSVDVEGLGRGLVGHERIDGTIDVRFHVRRIERFIAQKKKGIV